MNPNVKKGVYIALGIGVAIIAAIVIVDVVKKRKNIPNSAEGFNGVVEKARKVHPELYSWWESLPLERQISIENGMNSEILSWLNRELTKRNLSEEVMAQLRRIGYTG